MTWLNSVLPVVSLLLGAGLTYLTQAKQDERSGSREAGAAARLRADDRQDERRKFEIEALNSAHATFVELVDAYVAELDLGAPSTSESALILKTGMACEFILDNAARLAMRDAIDKVVDAAEQMRRGEHPTLDSSVVDARDAIGARIRALFSESSDQVVTNSFSGRT